MLSVKERVLGPFEVALGAISLQKGVVGDDVLGSTLMFKTAAVKRKLEVCTYPFGQVTSKPNSCQEEEEEEEEEKKKNKQLGSRSAVCKCQLQGRTSFISWTSFRARPRSPAFTHTSNTQLKAIASGLTSAETRLSYW